MRRLAIALTLAALVAAAAPSSAIAAPQPRPSATPGFAKEFSDANAQILFLGELVGDIVNRADRHSDAYLAGAFDVFARGMGHIRRRLALLDPPGEVAADYRRLRRAMRLVQGDLAGISRAARQHDPDAARRATTRLVEHSATLRSARRAVVRALR